MKSSTQITLFLFVILVVNYLLRVPWLIDEFHVSRFILLSVLCAVGTIWLFSLPKKLDLHLLDIALLGFYGINLFSVTWSFNFGEAIFTSQKYLLLAISFILFRVLFSDRQFWPVLSKLLNVLTLLVLLITSYQFIYFGTTLGFSGQTLYKVIGHSGHKNLVASFLFLLLGLQIYFLISKPAKSWQYVLLGWQLIAMLALRSRAVYTAMAIFFLVLAAYYLLSGRKELKQVIVRRVVPFVLTTSLIGALVISYTGIGKEYLRYLNPTTYSSSVSGSERLFVWYKTSELIEDNIWLGHGAGSWKLVFPSKNISGGYRLQEKDTVFTRAHNDFLEIWCEVGSVGLLLYLSIFGLAIWSLWARFRMEKVKQKNQLIVLIATLLGYLIISFFDFPKERLEHQTILALILAIALLKSKPFIKKKKVLYTFSGIGQKMFIGCLLALQVINLPIGYYRYIGDRNTKEIIIAMASQNTTTLREKAQSGHSAWYDLNPLAYPVRWYEGMAYYYEKNFQAAAAPFAEAYNVNPYNFNVINNYASTLVQIKKYKEAIPLYEQALRINPKFEESMFNLSFVYFQLGQYDLAEEWVNKTSKNPEKKKVFLEKIRMAKGE